MSFHQRFEILHKELQRRLDAQGRKSSVAFICKTLGVSQPSYDRWRRGESAPKVKDLTTFARVFGVSVDWLLLGEGAMFREEPAPQYAPMDEVWLHRVMEKLAPAIVRSGPQVAPENWADLLVALYLQGVGNAGAACAAHTQPHHALEGDAEFGPVRVGEIAPLARNRTAGTGTYPDAPRSGVRSGHGCEDVSDDAARETVDQDAPARDAMRKLHRLLRLDG